MKQTLERRSIIKAVAWLPIGLAVGCTLASPTTVSGISLTQALQGIQALGTSAQTIFSDLVSAGMQVGSGVANTAQTILTQIQNAAAAITPTSTQAAGQSVLSQIEGYVNALAPIAAPFVSLIPGAGGILAIAIAALPAIESGVNLIASLLTPAAKALVPTSSPTAAPLTPSAALTMLINKAQLTH